jgi:hypothetical protein
MRGVLLVRGYGASAVNIKIFLKSIDKKVSLVYNEVVTMVRNVH